MRTRGKEYNMTLAVLNISTALRLSRFFGTSEQFWLNLQDAWDLSRVKSGLASELKRIEPLKHVPESVIRS
jgi:plasmid maintenance system antidote protein VapI